MTKEELFNLINSNPAMQLATMDGDQPRVRGMLLFRAAEDGFIFHTANTKDVYKQIEANNKVEMCFMADGTQIRVTGEARRDTNPELESEIRSHPSRQFLQAWKDMDFEMIVYRVTNCTAVTWSFETNFDKKQPVRLCD